MLYPRKQQNLTEVNGESSLFFLLSEKKNPVLIYYY